MKIVEYEDKYLADVRDLLTELEEYLELSHLRSIEDENRKEQALTDEQRKRLFELTLLENGTHIILRYLAKNMIEKNLCKVEYNTIFNFLLFNDNNRLKVSINNNDVLTEKTPEFKLPEIFQFFVGCPDKEKKEYSFNGIIYPIILFEANDFDILAEAYESGKIATFLDNPSAGGAILAPCNRMP